MSAQSFDLAYDAENRLVSVNVVGGIGMALPVTLAYAPNSLQPLEQQHPVVHLAAYPYQPRLQSGFPSTPILEDFNRIENPLSTNWEPPLVGTIQANGSTGQGLSAQNEAVHTTQWSGDTEVFATLSTKPGSSQAVIIGLRGKDTGSQSTLDLYDLLVTVQKAADTWAIRRVENGVSTTLASGTQEYASGDQFGLSIIGTTLTAYYNGAVLGSAVDGTFSSPGKLSLSIHGTGVRVDYFGGGSVTGTSTPTPTATSTPTATATHTPTQTSTPVGPSGPVGFWKFDENSWTGDCSTVDILDSSGNNRHGTACINGDAPYPVPGMSGNAGSFDGINQYANMGPGFNFTSSFTAAVWIALDDYNSCGPVGNGQHIIGTHHLRTPTGHGRGWGIYWDCDGLVFH